MLHTCFVVRAGGSFITSPTSPWKPAAISIWTQTAAEPWHEMICSVHRADTHQPCAAQSTKASYQRCVWHTHPQTEAEGRDVQLGNKSSFYCTLMTQWQIAQDAPAFCLLLGRTQWGSSCCFYSEMWLPSSGAAGKCGEILNVSSVFTGDCLIWLFTISPTWIRT